MRKREKMTIQIQKQFDNLEDGIQNMINAAIHDYGQWMQPDTETRIKMNKEFAEGWVVKTGPKYAKIMQKNGGQVWGFVVAVDTDKKFKKGDLLKAAGLNAPARNAARGNVLEGNFNIRWTGPEFLEETVWFGWLLSLIILNATRITSLNEVL